MSGRRAKTRYGLSLCGQCWRSYLLLASGVSISFRSEPNMQRITSGSCYGAHDPEATLNVGAVAVSLCVCPNWIFMKLMPSAGEILSACSRAEAARNPAGAWFGEQVRKPVGAWTANLRSIGTSTMRRRSACWAILRGNPLHGARSRRGQPTVILAVRTGLANYPNRYGRWPASSFVETCADRD
jgi:hypothetical protein